MKRPYPVVSAAIFNEEAKVLLILRSEKVLSPHTWCLPGGYLDGLGA